MSLTYQPDRFGGILETYEWDNIWYDHADKDDKPRILVIGDSISCGYRPVLTVLLGGNTYVDAIGTSRAVDNPWFEQLLDCMLAQRSDYTAVIFNNGLHGFHLDAEAYEAGLLRMAAYLRQKLPHARLIMPLSTPVRKPGELMQLESRNETVIARNLALCRVAERVGAVTCDFYSALVDHPELWGGDGVHLAKEGYQLLASLCRDLL